MARGIAAGILVGAAVAACFSRPSRSFDDAGGTGSDGLVDTASGDGGNSVADAGADALETCLTLDFIETISNCGSWADTLVGSGSAGQTAGVLTLSMFATGSATAECRTVQSKAFGRAVLDVVSVNATPSPGEKTYFVIESGTARWGINWAFDGSGIGIVMTCSGGSTVPPPRRWMPATESVVRLRRDGMKLVVELATAASEPFTKFGECTVANSDLDDAKVVVGTTHVSGTTVTARFESLVVCE